MDEAGGIAILIVEEVVDRSFISFGLFDISICIGIDANGKRLMNRVGL